jgi:hypothetical protein
MNNRGSMNAKSDLLLMVGATVVDREQGREVVILRVETDGTYFVKGGANGRPYFETGADTWFCTEAALAV